MHDAHWNPALRHAPIKPRVRATRHALSLTMRDGTRLAIDVYVPRGPGVPSRLPTILRQTRYLRSLEPRMPVAMQPIVDTFDLYARTRRVFLGAGYAWIDVDVRGTGASTGVWAAPWYGDEVLDGAEVVDWIVQQPWSSGLVGSLGISYDGTAAEMLVANRHPAVRAVAPMFALYDVFADVAFPGGIQLAWFTQAWSEYNAALDRGRWDEGAGLLLWLVSRACVKSPAPHGLEHVFARLGRLGERAFRTRASALLRRLIRGVSPIDDDRDGRALAAAITTHRENTDIHATALGVSFRDQSGLSPRDPSLSVDGFSPHARRTDIEGSGTAIYSYSGWRDAAYPHSAIKRFLSVRTPGSRLTIGPWIHAGKLRISGHALADEVHFDHDAELLSFFDAHLRPEGARGDDEPPVHWYTLVEERWKSANSWPPPAHTRTFWLDDNHTLATDAPRGDDAHDTHRENGTNGTGERSRWRSLLSLVPGDYPDRRERDAMLLVYDSAPLERDAEMTGHAIVKLWIEWQGSDNGHVFAYLEDVAPDGRVHYVTEGQLRALHRALDPHGRAYETPAPWHSFLREHARPLAAGEVAEMVFDLIPISYLFRRGHRIRLAIAGADADHFATRAPVTMHVHRSKTRASRLELPIVGA